MLFRGDIFLCTLVLLFQNSLQRSFQSTDDLENYISSEDLNVLWNVPQTTESVVRDEYSQVHTHLDAPVICTGIGAKLQTFINKFLNMKPDSSESINTEFYFTSRNQRKRVQMYFGEQFGLEWVDFKPQRKTVMIVHGFMSHSNVSWVYEMTQAFLEWDDVNVITIDWSGGGNTWKYWKAVANTRRVGSDITEFLHQLMNATGVTPKDFHFVGHSLGAHISSYVSYCIGQVARITGLDPAQPCYSDAREEERLDRNDAEFVDIIHTNGRHESTIAFGLPGPIGHADFYPNGGMHQPGCFNNSQTSDYWRPVTLLRFMEAVCSHGRAYDFFIESLINKNCSFRAYQWDSTYEGINASIKATCDRRGSCSEMGIKAIGMEGLPRAEGIYFTLTTEKKPYCPSEDERRSPSEELLRDLKKEFRQDRGIKETTKVTTAYTDSDEKVDEVTTTTAKPNGWWSWMKNFSG